MAESTIIVEPSLADLRIAAGFASQAAAAAKLGLSPERVCQIERGGSDRLSLLERMAALYGVKLETVIAANRRTQD